MKTLVAFSVALLLFGAELALAEPAFRGYAAIEQTLTERLLSEGSEFSFKRFYLSGGDSRVDTKSLLGLLGTYDELSGSNQFQNGEPNSVNMLLWQLLLQLTGNDVAKHCDHQGNLRVNPYFQAALDPLCRWPAAEAKTDASLRGFWTSVMGYDAPEEEFLAWEQFALTSSYADKPAAEALPIFFFLIAYNPHFLLRD